MERDKINLYVSPDGQYWFINANGQWEEFVSSGGVSGNIYTLDGTLQGNRTVTGNSKNLTVSGIGNLTFIGTATYVTGGSGGLELKTESGGTLLISSNADLDMTAAASSAINMTKSGEGNINITQTGTGNVNITSSTGKSTIIDGVKIYEALVSQTFVSSTSGSLVIGEDYLIEALEVGDDFLNVGYVEEGTPFTATGTTPTNWTNGTEVINVGASAPNAIVLKNTLGGVPVWSYAGVGQYLLTLSSAFPAQKTVLLVGSYSANGSGNQTFFYRNDDNELALDTLSFNDVTPSFDPENDLLDNTSIIIKVYP